MRYCTYLIGLFLLLVVAPPSANGWSRRRRKYKYLKPRHLPKGFSLELRTTAIGDFINTKDTYHNRCKAKADTSYGFIKKAVFSSFNGGRCKSPRIKWKKRLIKKAERTCTFKWTRNHPLLWFYCKIVILIHKVKKRGKKVRLHPPLKKTYRLTIQKQLGPMEGKKYCMFYTIVLKKMKGGLEEELVVKSHYELSKISWEKSGATFTIPQSQATNYALQCERACLPSNRGLRAMTWIHQKRFKFDRKKASYRIWPLPKGVRVRYSHNVKSKLDFVNRSPKSNGIYYCESLNLIKTPPFYIKIVNDSGCKWNGKKCHRFARCINKRHRRGFRCQCRPGFRGDGRKLCKKLKTGKKRRPRKRRKHSKKRKRTRKKTGRKRKKGPPKTKRRRYSKKRRRNHRGKKIGRG